MRPSCDFNLHDDRGVRQIQQLGQQHARLAEALIVALQSGQDEIGLFLFEWPPPAICADAERIELCEFVVRDVDAAIGALGQRFLDGLLHALRAHGNGDHFAAVLFLQAQGFLERVSCPARSSQSRCRFRGSSRRSVMAQRSVLGGHLLDANDDLHRVPIASRRAGETLRQMLPDASATYCRSQRLNTSAALVPPKPKEFDSAYSTAALRAWFGT